jgi:hypothetical protein
MCWCYISYLLNHNVRNKQYKSDKRPTIKNNLSLQNITLFTTNAAVWFNKICGFNHLKPDYIHIQVNGNEAHGTV